VSRNLVLSATEGALELHVNRDDWCQVVLVREEKQALGADTRSIVRQRLVSILTPDQFPKPTHTLDGGEFTCFIMLSEEHASGYARLTQSGVVLHFRDTDGQHIGDMEVTFEECNRWKNLLGQYGSAE
jgi:hypothetical protein